jgi:hypothetical protein
MHTGRSHENPFGTVIAYCHYPVFSGFVSDENRENTGRGLVRVHYRVDRDRRGCQVAVRGMQVPQARKLKDLEREPLMPPAA